MKNISLPAAVALTLVLLAAPPAFSRTRRVGNPANALKSMYTPSYLSLKAAVLEELKGARTGRFAEDVSGLRRDTSPKRKVIALTFDACGGHKSGYNAELIDYLRRERLRATLFVTGIWIERNRETFLELARDPLFEIENHGLLHRVCSVTGRSKYGVLPTRDMGDVIDEMELNSRKIQELTGRRPAFFRPATAFADEASVRVAERLGMELVNYEVLSGDAMRASVGTMTRNLIRGAGKGSVVIMHFHRPEWGEVAALKAAVPVLRARGYTFDKLKNLPAAPAARGGRIGRRGKRAGAVRMNGERL
ncbi:MAG TPA: polysaccharide deacetylase family protein [Elusimicrobiales bacterium]|nr:polysaccharide deacetylase family protein [Elusimicrobiales bacterium]